jgi:hypothetical protein
MDYRPLGRTGITVSELCLGAMMFGAAGNTDHDDSIRIIHRALDAGINFIDTADIYSAGESEEIVGKALAGRRDDVVLATKVGLPFDEDPNHRGASRRWIIESVDRSLRRLGTDWIDLYQIHRLDPAVDIDETLGALSDLVEVDPVGAEPPQRPVDRLDDPAAGGAAVVGVVVERQSDLGREHDVVAPPGQCLADDLLGFAGRVDVRGVDEVDPGLERAVDDPDRGVVIGVAGGTEHHRAEAQLADGDPGPAQGAVVHEGSLSVSGVVSEA